MTIKENNGIMRAWNVGKGGVPIGAIGVLLVYYTSMPPEVVVALVAILTPVWAWFDKEYRSWKKIIANKK